MTVRVLRFIAAVLVGCTVGGVAEAGGTGDAARGEKLFRACKGCHTVGPGGRNIVGPRLYGLFGRKAGAVKDYKYSEALRNADIIWTEETVGKLFELGPDVFTPGSKMPLQAMTRAKDRADLIAFLKRITGPADGTRTAPGK